MSDRSSTTVLSTLARGLSLLEDIARSDGRARAKTLANRHDLKLSTCYQLLKTLESTGYVVRVAGGYYEIGPSVATLFRDLRETLNPNPRTARALAALRDRTGETSYACALRGSGIVLQQVLEGNGELLVRMLEPGMRSDLHARASCRAILAFLPQAERARMLPSRRLPKRTEFTITSRSALAAEFSQIRHHGYAVEREQFSEGVGCVAAPVFDEEGHVQGSLTVSMPITRLDRHEVAMIQAVRACADAASAGRQA